MRVVLVSSDLLMRSRLAGAVAVAPGGALPEADLYLIDLDEAGAIDPPPGGRAIGYFSHVNEALGAAARAKGLETMPRGRLLRELPTLLADP